MAAPAAHLLAAGLALVLVPITLGVSLVAGAIAQYHVQLYWAGGLLMIALGLLALSGRMWSMPSVLRAPDTARGDSATFFSLGVFSGIASSCCAPVLAGVMTLSALSGNAVGGALLGMAYVFGMVLPLFVMALAWDAAGLGERRWGRAKSLRWSVGTRTLHTNTVNVAVATAFVAMGIVVISLAGSTTMTGNATWFQRVASDGITRTAEQVLGWVAPVPEPLLGLGLLALAASFVWFTLRDRTRRTTTEADGSADAPEHPCHEHLSAPRQGANQP